MNPAAETFELPQRRRVAGLAYGAMQSVRRGSGFDIAGSRPYLPGDDIRRIDRRTSARYSSARDRDEWIVRQTYAEEATRAVVVADRRPSMRLFPPELPWLSKPRALAHTAELVCRSAAAAASLPAYIEADAGPEPYWLAPGRAAADEIARAARADRFDAPADTLDRALAYLYLRIRLPAGSFVFVVSDFLAPPSEETLGEAVSRRWEVVPVVLQDPVWERSFPDVAGAVLPVGDPETGRVRPVRLSRREVRERRERNEERFAGILDGLERFGLEPVLLDSHDPERILDACRDWALRGSGVGGKL